MNDDDEDIAILGADVVANIHATVASWPPLSPAQIELAVQVFTAAAAESDEEATSEQSGAA